MDSPCKQCIGLVMCNRRTLEHRLHICSMLRSAIIRESNILDPNGLSRLITLDNTYLRVTINTHTDSNHTPIKRSMQFLLSYYKDQVYRHDCANYNCNELLLGEYDQICNEVKSFYNKPYIGME